MKKRNGLLVALFAVAFIVAGCGSSGGGTGTDTEDGTTSVATLIALPSVDLSSYDYSSATADGSISKGLKSDTVDANASIAGCVTNIQKENIIRQSILAQFERCVPEGMEYGGLITIPTDDYSYVRIKMPTTSLTIPTDTRASDQIVANQSKSGGSGLSFSLPEYVYYKVGRIGGELQVDSCFKMSDDEIASQVGSSTYSATDNVYNVIVTRHEAQGSINFSGRLDISFSGFTAADSNDDGLVEVNSGNNYSVTVAGKTIDNYARGMANFTADAAAAKNVISGAINITKSTGGGTQDVTEKIYSELGDIQGSIIGSAQFSSSGTRPADQMTVGDTTGYFCPPSDCHCKSLTDTNAECVLEDCRPVPATTQVGGNYVCSYDRSGVESFSISGEPPDLTFTLISDLESSFFTSVDAFDLATLTVPSETEIAFLRTWDCEAVGSWTEIDPATIMEQLASTVSTIRLQEMVNKVASCMELKQKAGNRKGMDQNNCVRENMQKMGQ